ncbi:MAG: DMT family transporter [Betaproteobacteria bacterium]
MEGKLAPRIGIVILLGVSMCFSMNHIGARIGFDHGASVAAGVALRATSCALLLLGVIKLQGVAFAVPRELRGRALLAGALITSQSYCLFSAVASIPPALALLVFQTSPMFYVLLTWALGKEKPSWGALPPMLLALAGLVLALDLDPARLDARWSEIGVGTAWALGGGASMTVVYYLNANALKPLDGRLRTFIMTAVTSVLVLVAGGAAEALLWPQDATGWTGFAVLAAAYCAGTILLFYTIPRVSSTTTVALNFEPIALLLLAWLILGHTVTPLQIGGAFITVGAIVWLGLRKR